MSFESGNMSFRMFYLPRPLPKNALDLLAARAAPPLDMLVDGKIHGWVGGRHLLDRQVDEQSGLYAGYLRVILMMAEKKIPESLLRAECRMEELAQIQASGVAELSRKARSDIRKEIVAKLLPKMPPQLKGITLVHDRKSPYLLADAISDKQMEVFEGAFRDTFAFPLVPMNPFTAAAQRNKVDVRELAPTSFSTQCEDEEMENTPGRDFLTWLWYYSEMCGGRVQVPEHGDFAIGIDGALTFFMEGEGAHEMVLRRGTPIISTEAKTALLSGKKLRRAGYIVARGAEQWRFTIDGDEFVIRGLKLPEGEKLEPVSHFQERMVSVHVFMSALLAFYDVFLRERLNQTGWKRRQGDIKRWVEARATKR